MVPCFWISARPFSEELYASEGGLACSEVDGCNLVKWSFHPESFKHRALNPELCRHRRP